MDKFQLVPSTVVSSMQSQQFLAKKGFVDSIEASHQIVGELVLPGDYTFYCKFRLIFQCKLISCFCLNSYNTIKSQMSTDQPQVPLGPSQHVLAACEAGALTLVLTNPIWVVKTRLCLQYGGMDEHAVDASKRYVGMVDALRKVYHYEGIRGLYRGFVPGIFGVSHGALQFMAYEELKKYYVIKKGMSPNDKLSTVGYLSCAAASKLFAAVITYPYQVVRARLQDQYGTYSGVLDVIRRTWR